MLVISSKIFRKTIIFLVVFLLFIFAYQRGLSEYLTIDYLKGHLQQMQMYVRQNPTTAMIYYFSIYLFLAAISFPNAAILTLLAGALFGLTKGVLIVSLASTIGATLSFWGSRFLFTDLVSRKFHAQLAVVNQNVEREGGFYLLTLRLIPIFPFFMINLLMGITSISTGVFFLTSLIGMFPGTVVFVFAGERFSEITTLSGILSPEIFLALVALGLFPYVAKFLVNKFRHHLLYKKFTRPKSFDYNMIVIGAGAAGLVTSYIAATVKSKVALIEKGAMGGDCLNTGCIPSKALIKTAKIVHLKKRAQEFGLKKLEIEFEFPDVMNRIKKIIHSIEPHDSMERYRKLGVECFSGEAMVVSPYEVKINGKVLTTKNITLATGASPLVPKIEGIDKTNFLTSDTLWDLEVLPPRFLIIGGGPIGCEMAQAFSRLGSSVTIIEGGERLLSKEDSIASELIQKVFLKEGIKICTGHKALSFQVEDGQKILLCENPSGIIKIAYDEVLIAVGRKANVTGFGLESLAVSIRPNGTLETNEFMETTLPNVFACGDVTGPYQLTHMGAHQAWYCSVNALFGSFKKFKVDYHAVPWCTFTDPEVATVGINEETARSQGLEFEVTLYKMNDLDRAIADSETNGFVKVITKKGSDKILGATIVGAEASNLILEFVSAMKNHFGMRKILGTIHLYPSLGEANKYAAGEWSRNHAPENVLKFLQKYFKWTRS